jgi:hypothetical protein
MNNLSVYGLARDGVSGKSGKGEIFDSFKGPRKSWWGIKQRRA